MRLVRQLGPAVLAALSLQAATLEVRNDEGNLRIVVVNEPRLQYRVQDADGATVNQHVELTRGPDRVVMAPKPGVDEKLDFEIRLPLGYGVEAATLSGDISIEGMIHRVRMSTDTGAVHLKVPLRGTRFTLDAEGAPASFRAPPGVRFLQSLIDASHDRKIWRLRDALPDQAVVYGDYRINTKQPRSVTLENYDPGPDSPLKFPWEAPATLERIMTVSESAEEPQPVEDEENEEAASGILFRSDVRMANFVFAVTDREGRPLTGLRADDFEVVEDGERQDVARAGSDDVPFNLAILLDLSGSTKPDRVHMQQAAQGFIEVARPTDRVALYALAGGMFHVISPLTSERGDLLTRIRRLPGVAGASPLYDMITLAYAAELHGRAGERNGLIIISDGIDNQISKQEAPSSVKFKRLVKAAEQINAMIYPIFLRSGERFGRGWSRKGRERLEELASASGGKLFPALSIIDLESVFPLVEDELRSVYSVAYYPKNQEFDGSWRNVEVRVKRRGSQVRSRSGYYAR